MNSSLYTGVLGLKNHQIRMDVIGNNIANVNTYGFKKGRATFADLLSRTYYAAAAPSGDRGGINPLQVGLGMTTSAVTNIMNQGQLEMTGRLTDVAIDGNGWFVLQDGSGDTVYTRDGAFGLDREGSLVSASGWYVQGWTRVEVSDDHDFSVDTQRPVDQIDFQYGEKLEAAATNKVGLKCNLDEHSRSLIADGIDPKEGFATKNDLLVDLYDANNVNPESLGLREGDWIEIHVDVAAPDASTFPPATMQGLTATISTGVGNTADAAVAGNYTLWQHSGYLNSADLPMENLNLANLTGAGYTQSFNSPDQLAAGEFSIDQNNGTIWVATASLATSPLDTLTYNYDVDAVAESTLPYETDKYLYFQVSNDTTIGNLETAIQNGLDSVDVSGTINATVSYDVDTAQFSIYNNPVSGSRDYSNVHVEINAVSGSGIRRGYLLRESTFPTLTGTRLGISEGVLGGEMTQEHVGNFDYQTSVLNLSYGDVDESTDLSAQVIRTRLETSVTASTTSLALSDWTGYTGGSDGTANDLQMVADTAELIVNNTTWTKVNVFTGAANEYRISSAVAGSNVPVVLFNTADNKEPGNGGATADLIFSFRPSNAAAIDLTEGTDYEFDEASGEITLKWDSTSPTPDSVFGTGGVNMTGTIRLTASYTTEDRRLTPPGLDNEVGLTTTGATQNSRWSDFAQELAEVNVGGGGNARTDFNNMFAEFNASRTSGSATNGVIADQATTSQPTQIASTRFQSAETYRTSIDVFDSLGDTHTLQMIFTHVGSNYDLTEQTRYQNRWYWRAELPYSDVFAFDSMDMVNDTATARMNGELTFDSNGLLEFSELGGNTGPIMFDSSPIGSNGNTTEAVANVSIDLDFTGHGNAIDGVTQYASDFTTRAYEQNGWAMGILETFAVDQAGIIEGRYSNNVVKPIAQIALAMFPNQEGLSKEGNNVFALSANTGLPAVLPAFSGGAGSIIGGSLEQSNVDIVEEFTNMIITERGFQANSRIVTTSDEMLMEVINLKR